MAGVGAWVCRCLGSEGTICKNVVFWNLFLESSNNFVFVCFRNFRSSGKNPHILLTEEWSKTNAAVNDGVVVVVSCNDFVITSRHKWHKFDFEVSLILGRVNNKGVTFATTPLLFVN